MACVFLSLGSNLGDRAARLREAVQSLARTPHVNIIAVSSVYRSEPVDYVDQPDFLNAVVELETSLSARELLNLAQEIERSSGRKREIRYGPRSLDIDIILYGDEEIKEPDLVIPHPKLRERGFVLKPLLEVAPGLILPDGTSIEEVAKQIEGSSMVELERNVSIYGGIKDERVGFIGTGRVGTAMARALSLRGFEISGLFDMDSQASRRASEITGAPQRGKIEDITSGADIVFITTPDDEIENACRLICRSVKRLSGRKLIHMSGAKGLEPLESAKDFGAQIFAIHPIQTFADVKNAVEKLPGSTFGITCDEALYGWACELVNELGGEPLFIPDEERVLYHIGSVIACNLFIMLEHAALRVFELIGIDEEEALRALMPLVRSTLENIERMGPEQALTGPLSRGDVKTVTSHKFALSSLDRSLSDLYSSVSLWGLEMARARGLDDDKVCELRRILEEP
ncbi:MAG: 2-amino-4-hydroxy-6-hydroxymethyldihydropteridine diphosphokinase [Actinomycetota bacterium]|nr:2-amino-4-hydroxy-6-hydroxymethyldihydropteridine diphosphokinase [Actinomycetota bacterium]